MNRDFTHNQYEKLLLTINASCYTPLTVKNYLTSPIEYSIILRHDVDHAVERALKMAQLEHRLGVKSTYYFRKVKGVFNKNIIKEIANLEHEIGYHYETLDKAKGNINKAIYLFEKEIAEFREIADIKTVCMHGTPFTPWVNRDIWNNINFKDYGIIGEPYLSIDYNNVLYLTDTGRTWAGEKVNVKDVVNTKYNQGFSTTDSIIDLIKNKKFPNISLVIHPQRWNDNLGSWLWEISWQNIKNIGKRGLVLYTKYKSNKTDANLG